jgi:hypothetical protein
VSRVVIVARTRMHHDHVCIGGHDLDGRFRGVRLLDKFGGFWTSDAPFQVSEVWNVRYRRKNGAEPPHVEDAYVNDYQRIGQVEYLRAFVLKHVTPWGGGIDQLFEGTTHTTPSGSVYIPSQGRLPPCSTGYWTPDRDLMRQNIGARVRFITTGEGESRRLPWVGVQTPPERIEAGSLVRVSLTRPFSAGTTPEGHYLQISGVL